MNTLVLHGPPDQTDIRRWTLAAVLVVATHAALIAGGLTWYTAPDVLGTASEPIMLDLESAPQTPEPVQQDIAPGPQMTEAEPPPPEPEKPQEIVEEQIPPTPVQEKAEVVAPPEKKEKPKPIEKPKPKPVVKPKKPTDTPAPQTTATPRASQAAQYNYRGVVAAHLQRYKQYPSGANAANEQGIPTVAFSLNGSGRVTSAHVARSSGFRSLDAGALAIVYRAQPFPPPPPGATTSFTVPFNFNLR